MTPARDDGPMRRALVLPLVLLPACAGAGKPPPPPPPPPVLNAEPMPADSTFPRELDDPDLLLGRGAGDGNPTAKAPRRFDEHASADARVVELIDGLVILDVGARDGLLAGTRFLAYRDEKEGPRRMLALVEVCAVESARAAAVLLRGSGDDLRAGTELASPVFDVEEQKVFVFRRPPPWWVVAAMTWFGARVDAKVSIETDFLVLPPGFAEGREPEEDEALHKARQFGVFELSSEEAALYLGLR